MSLFTPQPKNSSTTLSYTPTTLTSIRLPLHIRQNEDSMGKVVRMLGGEESVLGVFESARVWRERKQKEKDARDKSPKKQKRSSGGNASSDDKASRPRLGTSNKAGIQSSQYHIKQQNRILEFTFGNNPVSQHMDTSQDTNADTPRIRTDEAQNMKRVSMRSSRPRRVCRLLMKVEKLPHQQHVAFARSDAPRINVHLRPIEQHIDFDHLCDFQFLAQSRLKNTNDIESARYVALAPSNFAPIPGSHTGVPNQHHTAGPLSQARGYDTNLPPGVFDYRFESKVIKKRGKYRTGFFIDENDPKPKYFVGEDCTNVNAPRKEVPRSNDPAEQLLRDTIARMFEVRPIWRRRTLLAFLGTHPFVTDFRVRNQLIYFAYAMTSGPYKHLLIKYGVDPKTSVQYAKYQNLKFSLPRALREFVEEGSEQHSTVIFDGVPQQWFTVYCLCDIRLKKVIKMVKNQIDKYVEVRGFYKKEIMDKMREAMKEKARQYINAMENNPNWTKPTNDRDMYYEDPFHDIEPGEFDLTEQLNNVGFSLDEEKEKTEEEAEAEESDESSAEDDDDMRDEE